MHLDIDRFAGYNSPIHNWDTRFKIFSIFLLIITISFLKNPPALAFSIITVALILAISSIPPVKILKTLIIPVLFLIPLFILLPLTSGGNPLYFAGIRFFEEGIVLSVQIAVKAISIITLFILLAGTSPFNITLKALRSLKIPPVMTDIILFTYRYIHLYIDDLRTLKKSLILRGYKKTGLLRSFRVYSHLIGSLLVRSFEQTERIFNAMTCRGYNGEVKTASSFKSGFYDYIKSAVVISIAAGIFMLELLL